MAKFETEKNGYNKSQVETYVAELEMQLSNALSRNKNLEKELYSIEKNQEDFKTKSQNISVALTAAVEKARQIETSSRNVYKLKIQQLELLYNRWEGLLNEMLKKYPAIKDVDNVKAVMKEFKQSIKNTLKDDFKITSFNTASDSDPIRVLLSRMNEHIEKTPITKVATIERNKLPKDVITSQTELARMEEKAPLIKPIYSASIEKDEKYETLADKFLKENPEDTIYNQKFGSQSYPTTNESGFDLKEAVNPKDDLSEIMRSFDFYEDDDKN